MHGFAKEVFKDGVRAPTRSKAIKAIYQPTLSLDPRTRQWPEFGASHLCINAINHPQSHQP